MSRFLLLASLLVFSLCPAATYYVHPEAGADSNPGTDARVPWRTLAKASATRLQAGDRLLLAAGQTFHGQLAFEGIAGNPRQPIILSTYSQPAAGSNIFAVIDAKGCLAAVHLKNTRHIQVSNLVLTADGGGHKPGQPADLKMRCGLLAEATAAGTYEGFKLANLIVSNVSYSDPGFVRPADDVRTANGLQPYGYGIRFIAGAPQANFSRIAISDCQIQDITHTGLKFTGQSNGVRQVRVERVKVLRSGGPGIQMSGLTGGRFRELYVNGSGSTNDSRNWGRGSGLWTWGSRDVVIERGRFLNANGPGDSAGVHIDYHCRDVVVQHNVSANNAGGFCEILGNNHNCAYRYNLSINDGHRVKGVNGAFQEGKIFWLSGYTGKTRSGPFNSYFYNNTIYTRPGLEAKIAIAPTASGMLIANNIFYLLGPARSVEGDQFHPDPGSLKSMTNCVFENNLFLAAANWPEDLEIRDHSPLFGDPEFRGPGGLDIEDYIPLNEALVSNRGRRITRIPGDSRGLAIGLEVKHDLSGNKISGLPDLGALEVVNRKKLTRK